MQRRESDHSRRVVVVYDDGRHEAEHERVVSLELARRLAELQDYEFAGMYSEAAEYRGRPYFVPMETLSGRDSDRLGIESEADLFGGVVPADFVGTKSITHPLIAADADAVAGWSSEFGQRIEGAALAGFTAFSLADARRAGLQLLRQGRVRVKAVLANAGRGQSVAHDEAELERALAALDVDEVRRFGVVLEEDLDAVETFSVGQLRVGSTIVSYYGSQRLTTDNHGAEVYGGSDLVVVAGGFDALLALDLPADIRLAVRQAKRYDDAAHACYPGLITSRRNYDIAAGIGTDGRRRSGVLEQSWRIGGASSAEVAAMETLRRADAPRSVRASSHELYGDRQPPVDAVVLYRGEDPDVGPLTKCVTVERYDGNQQTGRNHS